MESAREARRRRIIERGSDRLAFIIGEARTLPPERDENPVTAGCEDDTTRAVLPNQQIRTEDVARVMTNDRKDMFPISGATSEISKPHDEIVQEENPVCETSNGAASSVELFTTSVADRPSDRVSETAPSRAARKNPWNFSSKQISRAISASENIRLLSAITIAFLVVLLNNYSVGGVTAKGIIGSRPLFVLLLTDATIILGMLMLTKRIQKRDDKKVQMKKSEIDLADTIGKSLEAGLLILKVMRAVLMDCSICAVIMICGLGI
ncbi:uncharacterized protein [Typha angustifolia]|uniref:uncharacterized protein n=1 Tax=Typha angustifolia TaxID=59011 RepID=UPI003C2C9F5D